MNEEKLSQNFVLKEFDLEYVTDTRILQNYKFLCDVFLEPVREHFGCAIRISSGYRNPLKNAAVGGKSKSYHMAEGGCAACDFIVDGTGIFIVFEWLRLSSKLPFDKIILEYKNNDPMAIHVQIDRTKNPRRRAFVGQTGDSKAYEEVPVI